MKKLIGVNKVKTAVFISGNGSNFKNLIRFSLLKNSPIRIECVISNNKNSNGLKYAYKTNIKKKIYNFNNRKNIDRSILLFLKKEKIKLICLAGFMKILSKNFIKRFNGKIINIHPSLLPKYKGLDTHQKAINNKDKYSGCTVHFVNSRLDSGKIILQKKIRILKKDNQKTLAQRILKQEHILYPKAITKIIASL
tara:strand:- start:21 stop:605 length:585 start_codon:yes stop_codon:yes gene_type:complete